MAHRRKTNEEVRLSISDALVELMSEKALDEIRVSELVQRAHVARVSFYRNYGSKDDVLRERARQLTESFLEGYPPERRETDRPAFLAACLRFYYDHRALVERLMESGRMDIVREEFNRAFGVGCPDRRLSARRSFLAGGLYNLAYRWTTVGYDITPEHLAEFVSELLFNDHPKVVEG